MMIRLATTATCVALFSLPVQADQADALLDALGVEQIIDVMRTEGLDYGDDLAGEMFPGGASQSWRDAVDRIYDTDRMEMTVRSEFSAALGDADVTPMLEFFGTREGMRLVELEVSARTAMIEDEIEEMARATYRDLSGSDDDRLALIEDYVQSNDLIEANVVGAMNASMQFYGGLVDGGALELSQDEILRDVWEQEEETRTDTREWVHGFLLMAYGPLEDSTLKTYTALSETPAGEAMNRALFAGFDRMYGDISYALGRAAARQMQTQDL